MNVTPVLDSSNASATEASPKSISTRTTTTHGGHGPVSPGQTTFVNDVLAIAQGTESIGNTKTDELFTYKTDRWGNGFIKVSRLGAHLLNLLKIDNLELRDLFPLHAFDPRAQIFFKGLDLFDFGNLLRFYPNFSGPEALQYTSVLNSFVEYLRREVTEPSFLKRLGRVRRSARNAEKSVLAYLQSLLRSRSKVVIVRVDLSYLKHVEWAGTVDYATVRTHKGQLIKYLRQQFPDVMLGYTWKLEYGLEKEYHIHLTVIFDGHKVRSDIVLADIIGRHWSLDITESRGMHWNCNRRKGDYWYLALGRVSRDDPATRLGLMKIAEYVTKPDFVLRDFIPRGHRSFGKGGQPKTKKGAKRLLAMPADPHFWDKAI